MITYSCTYVSKTVETVYYKEGCDPKSLIETLSQPCRIHAHSLPELIDNIKEHFALELDDIFISPDDEEINRIGYSRMENNDCFPPTQSEMEQWKKGETKLYLCDYCFSIEKTLAEPIHLSEFKQTNIKFH